MITRAEPQRTKKALPNTLKFHLLKKGRMDHHGGGGGVIGQVLVIAAVHLVNTKPQNYVELHHKIESS